jgi:16S rRNA (guanine966-N2)-methyltransferase
LRIISGKYKGRQIQAPSNLPVRPTTDFAKTGLFNILENKFEISQMDCLDLFAGTGSISLELVSRGAKHVTAIDRDGHCCSFMKSIAEQLHIINLRVHRADVMAYIKKVTTPFDLVFADPPYDSKIHSTLHTLVFEHKLLKNNGVFILEHFVKEDYSSLTGFESKRLYGNVAFSFFFNLDAA